MTLMNFSSLTQIEDLRARVCSLEGGSIVGASLLVIGKCEKVSSATGNPER
jgi:hypothetical protein